MTEASPIRRRFHVGIQSISTLTPETDVQSPADLDGLEAYSLTSAARRARASAAIGLAVLNLRIAHRRLEEALRLAPQLADLLVIPTELEHSAACDALRDLCDVTIGGAR